MLVKFLEINRQEWLGRAGLGRAAGEAIRDAGTLGRGAGRGLTACRRARPTGRWRLDVRRRRKLPGPGWTAGGGRTVVAWPPRLPQERHRMLCSLRAGLSRPPWGPCSCSITVSLCQHLSRGAWTGPVLRPWLSDGRPRWLSWLSPVGPLFSLLPRPPWFRPLVPLLLDGDVTLSLKCTMRKLFSGFVASWKRL